MAERDTHEKSDKDLEARFLKAFDEYNDALFRHAYIRVSDRERAIDLVHDTFTKVWSYVRGGHEIESYRPFLYKVLNNLIIDSYRKGKDVSLDALMEEEGVDEGSFSELNKDDVGSMIDYLDGKQALELISELPDVYREVLILRFVDGLGPKEMTELVEESENVISVRLHRGMKLLKESLDALQAQADQKRKGANA